MLSETRLGNQIKGQLLILASSTASVGACIQLLVAVRRALVRYFTLHYITLHYITVQYSTVQYSTVQYSTVQYSTYNALHHINLH